MLQAFRFGTRLYIETWRTPPETDRTQSDGIPEKKEKAAKPEDLGLLQEFGALQTWTFHTSIRQYLSCASFQ